MTKDAPLDPESSRLAENARREQNWQRWGPYLSERQWATVREDYSDGGSFWDSFPYEQSLARAYRWGEDGLLGITDRECRLCFAPAFWNGRDPHLKERFFGLTNAEGNHGEDVKEVYHYLDATPTQSYLKALYKYPQAEFPYAQLRAENHRRNRDVPEYELIDTGIFDAGRYWDITVEYAKATPDDILIRLTIANRGPDAAQIQVLPTLWFRNTWSWGAGYDEGQWAKPRLTRLEGEAIQAEHDTLGRFIFQADQPPTAWIFTENETNPQTFESGLPALANSIGRAVGLGKGSGPYKDAFHHYVVAGVQSGVHHDEGTKAAAVYAVDVPASEEVVLRLRLTAAPTADQTPFAHFDQIFTQRIDEADAFYAASSPPGISPAEFPVRRQAYAGLIWSKQFYQYIVPDWIEGDANYPISPEVQAKRINQDWKHLFSRDVVSVPDKWEYPAFFGWDLAFHMIPLAKVDPQFAKDQLLLLLREWYMHPNGQLPAYEYELSNVDPPVHAWACWQVFCRSGRDDHHFLKRCFHKLLLNFTWWVNRKDPEGRGVFGGGFLGMDNIGVFNRSESLPDGLQLQQADGTAWMGFYCTSMLQIALELALHDPSYEDVASKFFEHFILISNAINKLGDCGLWDDDNGFYYDQLLRSDGTSLPLKLRGLVGFVPLLAVLMLKEEETGVPLPGFHKRLEWFIANRKSQIKRVEELETRGTEPKRTLLLSLAGRERLERALRSLLDEAEFLSPFGIRSLSLVYKENPYQIQVDGRKFTVGYVPGEMDSADFGGNSNWRGPIWMPLNFLLIEALREYHRFYGDDLKIECPTGSGNQVNLSEAADELARRLGSLFVPVDGGARPCLGAFERFAVDPHWRNHELFFEYFHGDTGRGLGASHQTGWTALVATLIEDRAARARARDQDRV